MADYFQDLFADNRCWGCGTFNPNALYIKSEWSIPGEEAISTFVPRPEHISGPSDVVHSGILGALIDCHSICTAMAREYHVDGRAIGDGEQIWCVTGTMMIKYLKPTPMNQAIELT